MSHKNTALERYLNHVARHVGPVARLRLHSAGCCSASPPPIPCLKSDRSNAPRGRRVRIEVLAHGGVRVVAMV